MILVFGQTGLCKHCRPRINSSLIRFYTVCGQTLLTQIRLLEHSDQGLHHLPFRLLDPTHYSVVHLYCSNFSIITAIFRVSESSGFLRFSSFLCRVVPMSTLEIKAKW